MKMFFRNIFIAVEFLRYQQLTQKVAANFLEIKIVYVAPFISFFSLPHT